MPVVATPAGMKKLSEVARFVVAPQGIVSTDWPQVRDTCRDKLGIRFDGWQDGVGRLLLARRADGKLAATVGGVGLCFPRQVGKTWLLTGLMFGLCVDTPGLLVAWTSHHQKTTSETFMVMQGWAKNPQIAPFVQRVYTGSGDEEIRFKSGSRILFGARERGFGRGMAGVDALIMDEAQILSERALQNMLATLNVSSLGLHVYVGTPPKPSDACETFTRMRTEALSGEATDLVWVECGADAGADLDDKRQYAKANPSYPHRTPLESILRLRKKLDPDGFRREALGIWDVSAGAVFDMPAWVGCEDRGVVPPARVALVVDVSPFRAQASIAVAGAVGDKTVVLCEVAEGTGWVAGKVAELVAGRDIVEVAVTPGEARGLEGELYRAGIEVRKLSGVEVAASCTAFQAAVTDGTLVHCGQPELDVAVANVRTRRMGDAETWDRDFGTEVSPLVAAAAAFHRWAVLGLAPYDLLESVPM